MDMEKITEQKNLFDHIYNQQKGIYLKIAQNAGIAEIPYRILYALCADAKKWSQIDICREWNYAKQSVNTAVSKLVKQGYVSLKPDKEAAGNRKVITLTKAGRELCDRWVRPVIQADIKAFAALSDEERELSIALRKRRYGIVKSELRDLLEASGGEEAVNE